MVEDEIKAIICFELKNYLLNEIISINAILEIILEKQKTIANSIDKLLM